MESRTIFVIRDFEIDQVVGLALEFLAKYPPDGALLSVPGVPGAVEQGRLIADVLDPAIARSQYVIAFMDTPNANVGFELGFALGSDRHVALVSASTELPEWLHAAPLSGYLVQTGVQLPQLQEIIEQDEHIQVDGAPTHGIDRLFLAPRTGEGLVGHELVRRFYRDWRSPQATGWTLQELPRQLDGVGEVIWLVTPFTEGLDRRDGQGNSLNAVIAGYAKGKGIPLRILKSTRHRRIVDIEDKANRFTHLHELEQLLDAAEETRKMAVSGNVSAHEPAARAELERVIGGDPRSFVSVEWYARGLAIAQAVGRLSLFGRAVATCFLVSPRHVLTAWHVVPTADAARECTIVFEAGGTATSEVRRVQSLLWTSGGADLDVTILELDQPVDHAQALSLWEGAEARPRVGERVVVISYPFGGALTFSFSDESSVIGIGDNVVHYLTSTSPGSSGSPVFDRDWNLIAMHHASSGPFEEAAGARRSEGIRISAIRQALEHYPAVRDVVDG